MLTSKAVFAQERRQDITQEQLKLNRLLPTLRIGQRGRKTERELLVEDRPGDLLGGQAGAADVDDDVLPEGEVRRVFRSFGPVGAALVEERSRTAEDDAFDAPPHVLGKRSHNLQPADAAPVVSVFDRDEELVDAEEDGQCLCAQLFARAGDTGEGLLDADGSICIVHTVGTFKLCARREHGADERDVGIDPLLASVLTLVLILGLFCIVDIGLAIIKEREVKDLVAKLRR